MAGLNDFGSSMFIGAANRPGLFSESIESHTAPFMSEVFGDNPLAGMAMQMGMQWLFGNEGFLPAQFMPVQNIADQIRAQQFQLQRFQAMQQGFEKDKPQLVQMMRGLAQMTGVDFGMDQLRAANNIAGGVTAVMPFLAQTAPLTFDSMFGATGSKGIAAMNMFGRGQHEVDPVTGLIGQTPETISQKVDALFHNLYETGPTGAGLAAMRSIGIGGATSMLSEMGRLGIGGPSIGAMSPDEQNQRLQDIRKELGQPNMALDDAKRLFDNHQAEQGISKMVGAVSAIRDLFGTQGKGDAPMQQLFQAISNLSSGGLMMQEPAALENQIRTTQAVLRQGGVSLDAYSSLLARGSHTAQVMGLEPQAAAGFTLPAVAAGAAFGQGAWSGVRGWGIPTREQYTMDDAQLRASARASGQADQLAALVMFQEQVGGLKGEELEIYNAIKEGRTTFGKNNTSLYMQPQEMEQRLAKYAGPNARMLLQGKDALQPFIEANNIGSTVRRLQAQEAQELGSRAFLGVLGMAGVKNFDEVSAAMGDVLFHMKPEDVADDRKRTDVLAGELQKRIGNRDDLRTLATSAWSEFGRYSRSELSKTPLAVLAEFDSRQLEMTERRMTEAKQEGAMAQALSPLNQQGMLSRLSDLIKNPPGGIVEGVAKLLGGVPLADLNKAVEGAALGPRDAIGNLGDADVKTRLAVVSKAINATQAAFDDARAHGAPGAVTAALTAEAAALVSGGNVSTVAFTQLRDQFKAKYGMSDQDIDAALKGVPGKLSEGERARLAGLAAVSGKKIGAVGLATEAGVNTTAKISGDEMNALAVKSDDYMKERRRFDDMVAGTSAAASEQRSLGKMGGTMVSEAKRLAGIALADDSNKTFEAFGPGSVERITNMDAATKEIEVIAASVNMSVDDLLSNQDKTGPTAAARERVKERMGAISTESNKLADEYRKQGKAKQALTAKDLAGAKKYRDDMAADPKARNKKVLEDILRQTGGTMSDADKETVLKQMGTLKDKTQDMLHAELLTGVKARDEIDHEDWQTMLKPGLHASRATLAGRLTDIGKAGDMRHMGGHGGDSSTAKEAILDFVKKAQEKEKHEGEESKVMTLKLAAGSKIILEDNRTADVSHISGSTGSTPPAGRA